MIRGPFFEDTLRVRAAALTYFIVLSLVPLLAFAFALREGFGIRHLLAGAPTAFAPRIRFGGGLANPWKGDRGRGRSPAECATPSGP